MFIALMVFISLIMSGCILELKLATDKYHREPIWPMLDKKFVDWPDNPRFAVCDDGTPDNESDDMVLDKETGLIWARDTNISLVQLKWSDAVGYCITVVHLGNRDGWRLPTVVELLSLRGKKQSISVILPDGHPFINIQSNTYWSSTTHTQDNSRAWVVSGTGSGVGITDKHQNYWAWPVRGGSGPALVTNTP